MHATGREKPAAVRPLEARPAVHGRDDGAVARAGGVHRPVHQLVQALRVAVVGAGQRRLGSRQPDDRLPARRPRPGAPRREPLSGRRHERLPDLRRDGRRRAVRHRARAQARARVQGQRLPREGHAAHAARPVRGDRGAGAVGGGASRSSARTSSTITSTPRGSSRRPTTRSSIPGIASATSSAADRTLRDRDTSSRRAPAGPSAP